MNEQNLGFNHRHTNQKQRMGKSRIRRNLLCPRIRALGYKFMLVSSIIIFSIQGWTAENEVRQNQSSLKTAVIPIAVAPLRVVNVTLEEALIIADTLRSALADTKTFRTVDRANMEQLLGEQRLERTGITNETDAVRMGRILNVEEMAFGSLTNLEGSYYLAVTVISVETAEVRASKTIHKSSIKNLIHQLPAFAEKISSDVLNSRHSSK